jgi:hypothetical protein
MSGGLNLSTPEAHAATFAEMQNGCRPEQGPHMRRPAQVEYGLANNAAHLQAAVLAAREAGCLQPTKSRSFEAKQASFGTGSLCQPGRHGQVQEPQAPESRRDQMVWLKMAARQQVAGKPDP